MGIYINPAIKQLKDQQVRYAPRQVRLEQIGRAESLMAELQTEQEYEYNKLQTRITDHKSEAYPDLKIEGKVAVHDLAKFVEDLSDSVDLTPGELEEPTITVEELSERFQVSTKTVDRWRTRGLVGRKLKVGSRKRVVFLKSSVDRFVKENAREIRRSSRFSQLTAQDRLEIIERARKMAGHGACLSEISKRLAKKMGRSVETIRYTLKNHDRDYPESAVFPHARGPLTDEKRREIFHKHQRGTSVNELARQYCRTRSSIHRIVNEVRAERIMEVSLDFIDSDEFHQKGADRVILEADAPVAERAEPKQKVPPGLPAYLASLYELPLLTRAQEQYYFRKMNYLKFKAQELREDLNTDRPSARLMTKIEDLIREAVAVKNFLIRSNLRLVVSIAKRHFKPQANFFEMVSDGNMSLIRAIEKFDYSQGNKFSTYATWAIMKNYARSIPTELKQLDRYRTGHDELFSQSTDARDNPFRQELNQQHQHSAIMSILGQLDPRERDIILHRFGLNKGTEPETLEQVGHRFGVTKERIRQIESRALSKLKKIAVEEKLEIPGV
ncbi:MAG: sigma-70 family RNA polymerase sigma factor [Rubinisphaera brasiliensis]|uniref:sigma-70 family RNA polymerase sigma factor n=1 Tax=Rubinisphaera brasiliensis TaxID=119 RepID=UPI00391D356D